MVCKIREKSSQHTSAKDYLNTKYLYSKYNAFSHTCKNSSMI